MIPSRRRSRNERCRLGPEPIGGKLVGLVRDKLLSKDSVVGLPDATGGLFDRCDSVVSSSMGAAAPWMPMPIGGGVWPLGRLWLWWVISLNDRCFGEQSRDIVSRLRILARFFLVQSGNLAVQSFWTDRVDDGSDFMDWFGIDFFKLNVNRWWTWRWELFVGRFLVLNIISLS